MKLRVLIAAGGTGGHLFPAQQLCELLLKEGDCDLFFAGYKLQDSPFFKKEKIPFQEIASAPTKEIFPFLKAVWKGFWQSVALIRRFKPAVVVGFGSYHSFPLLLAAALLRKKLVLFEANCILGKVNRLFIPAAEKIACQFPIKNRKSVLVPFLPWMKRRDWEVEEARKAYGLNVSRFTILVFGGSQGAAFLNGEFPKAAALLHQKGYDFQVVHLTGIGGKAEYLNPAAVKEFEKEMPQAYAAADLVVCRSGAGTMAELIRFQKPALLIPYPYAAEDHQKINGQFLTQKIGGGRLLIQSEASAEKMAEELEILWKEKANYVEALRKALLHEPAKIDFGALVKSVGKG